MCFTIELPRPKISSRQSQSVRSPADLEVFRGSAAIDWSCLPAWLAGWPPLANEIRFPWCRLQWGSRVVGNNVEKNAELFCSGFQWRSDESLRLVDPCLRPLLPPSQNSGRNATLWSKIAKQCRVAGLGAGKGRGRLPRPIKCVMLSPSKFLL